jgi:hypothetical protein
MIEERTYQEPRTKNQEPLRPGSEQARTENWFHTNKPEAKATKPFMASEVLGSPKGTRFLVLLRQARWFRLLLFLGVVVLLSLAGAELGRGFGADSQPALIVQTIEPASASAPTAAPLPTSVSVAPIVAPAATPGASAGAPTAAALPAPGPPVNGSAWPVLLDESFDRVSASWPEVLGPSWWSRYRDGGYEMVLSGRPSISYSSPLPSHDFWFGADVQVAHGRAGLFFLLDRPNDFYRLLIDAEGRYRLEWQQVGYSRPLIDWTASDALRRGERALNQIAAQRQGDTLTLYANGVLLNTYALMPGNTLGSRVGLALDAPEGQQAAQAWFDNLVVRVPK